MDLSETQEDVQKRLEDLSEQWEAKKDRERKENKGRFGREGRKNEKLQKELSHREEAFQLEITEEENELLEILLIKRSTPRTQEEKQLPLMYCCF